MLKVLTSQFKISASLLCPIVHTKQYKLQFKFNSDDGKLKQLENHLIRIQIHNVSGLKDIQAPNKLQIDKFNQDVRFTNSFQLKLTQAFQTFSSQA